MSSEIATLKMCRSTSQGFLVLRSALIGLEVRTPYVLKNNIRLTMEFHVECFSNQPTYFGPKTITNGSFLFI